MCWISQKILSKKKKVREGGEDGCPLASVFFGFSRIWAARLILSPVNCNSKQRMQVPVQVCLLVTFASYFELIGYCIQYSTSFSSYLNPPWKCISIAQSQIMADLNSDRKYRKRSLDIGYSSPGWRSPAQPRAA